MFLWAGVKSNQSMALQKYIKHEEKDNPKSYLHVRINL